MKKLISILTACLFVFALFSCSSTSNDSTDEGSTRINKEYNASVFFQNLTDGDTLNSPFTIEMGVEGMNVEPAGKFNEGFGHHHIIVNCTHIDADNIIPADKKHIHFGQGETETELELKKGNYCLTLQFADGLHKSYGEELSKTINIVVE
jgi:hypothetical protein